MRLKKNTASKRSSPLTVALDAEVLESPMQSSAAAEPPTEVVADGATDALQVPGTATHLSCHFHCEATLRHSSVRFSPNRRGHTAVSIYVAICMLGGF